MEAQTAVDLDGSAAPELDSENTFGAGGGSGARSGGFGARADAGRDTWMCRSPIRRPSRRSAAEAAEAKVKTTRAEAEETCARVCPRSRCRSQRGGGEPPRARRRGEHLADVALGERAGEVKDAHARAVVLLCGGEFGHLGDAEVRGRVAGRLRRRRGCFGVSRRGVREARGRRGLVETPRRGARDALAARRGGCHVRGEAIGVPARAAQALGLGRARVPRRRRTTGFSRENLDARLEFRNPDETRRRGRAQPDPSRCACPASQRRPRGPDMRYKHMSEAEGVGTRGS